MCRNWAWSTSTKVTKSSVSSVVCSTAWPFCRSVISPSDSITCALLCRLVPGPLVDYFDSTYVNGACRPAPADNTTAEPRRRRPRFPPTTWNVHELTLNGGDRTNNSAEAWNRRFECLLGHNNPSIWTVIEMLQADAATTPLWLNTRMAVWHGSDALQKCHSDAWQLTRLCQEYVEKQRNMADFLRAVAYQIRFQ